MRNHTTFYSCRYNNSAAEPTPGSRMISFTIFDDEFSSSVEVGLEVSVIDDNPTMVRKGGEREKNINGDQ